MNLSERDVYYCFDFEDTLEKLMEDLHRIPDVKCKIIPKGNSRKQWDSYNWALSNMVLNMRKEHVNGVFDVVYLDGAHTLFHDGLAICLLKELVKINGILILDDVFWYYNICEWGQQYGPSRLTMGQMDDYQILRAKELFLTHDSNFLELSDEKSWRGIFRKLH